MLLTGSSVEFSNIPYQEVQFVGGQNLSTLSFGPMTAQKI
jgi:hypothetical protein